jgi:hypothetical protein
MPCACMNSDMMNNIFTSLLMTFKCKIFFYGECLIKTNGLINEIKQFLP